MNVPFHKNRVVLLIFVWMVILCQCRQGEVYLSETLSEEDHDLCSQLARKGGRVAVDEEMRELRYRACSDAVSGRLVA